MFDKIKINDPKVRDWFFQAFNAKVRVNQQQDAKQSAEINLQLTSLRNQKSRLLNLRLMDEIDEDTFAAKNTELRDHITELSLKLDTDEQNRAEQGEIALKVFELSQTLEEKWLTADYRAKRRILEIVCLNFFLRDVSLDVTLNKPFDVFVEGLESAENRGDRI